jgi:lantibiotic leader peptide-processing serine protease
MRKGRLVRSPGTALTAVLVLTACGTDRAMAPPGQQFDVPLLANALEAVPGSYLISAKSTQVGAIMQAVKSLGGTVTHNLSKISAVTASGLDAADVTALRNRTDVKRVDADLTFQFLPPMQRSTPQQASNVSAQGTDQSGAFFYPVQWNLHVTQADDAWATTNTGAGRKVCVLDTGIDPGQLDLNGKVVYAQSVIAVPRFASDVSFLDLNFHGTHVASIISSNGLGMASVAPDASICALKVLSEDGRGSFGDVIFGIMHAADLGANVINMSLGAYPIPKHGIEGVVPLLAAIQNAINFAHRKGAVVVASAGNQGVNLDTDNPLFLSVPAQLNNVVSVGATGPDNGTNFDRLASYSNHGGATGIDLVAPGGDLTNPAATFDLVLGACSRFVCGADGFYVLVAGTSQAAPHVSGAAAVVGAQLGGAPSPATVIACILNNTDIVGPSNIFGKGRLNVLKAAACGGST